MRTSTPKKSAPKVFKKKSYASKYAKEAVRQAMGKHSDTTVIYHSAFPIGQALADVIAMRCAKRGIVSGLTSLIEGLLGYDLSDDTPEQAARRGLICGLCWEIQALLELGSSGGFHFNTEDEAQILNEAVANSRATAAIVQAQMNEVTL